MNSPTANPISAPITSGTGKKPTTMVKANPSSSPLNVQIAMAGQRGSVKVGSFFVQ